MCAHFTTDLTNPKIMAIYKAAAANGLSEDMSLMMKQKGEIFPGCVVPVLAAPENYRPMEWGFPRPGKEVNYNARSEGAMDETSMFREPMLRRRCAVPVTGYYETWRKGSREVKYFFKLPGGGIMFLAGCWKQERGKLRPVFTLLTMEATGENTEVHHRMPVILRPELVDDWLVSSPAPMNDPMLDVVFEAVYPEGSLFDLI